MIRAVLDTNVIVSGILKGNSPPGRLLGALLNGRFQAVTSAGLLSEVTRVLAYPKIRERYRVHPEAAEAVVELLTLLSDQVEPQRVSWRASRDPKDDPFVACALQGDADYIVTGDQDLLTLKAFRGVQMVTAETFLKLLK